MEARMEIKWMLSVLLLFFSLAVFAQEEEKQSVGEMVYMEYQENGIDRALEKYRQAKTSEKDRYEWNEWELNNIGYTIMTEDGDLEAAEKVFKLNMEEYPEAANPYDSYADYLLETGNIKEAREYLKKSIEIAEKSEKEDEKTRILYTSKGKLAKLENKDKQLDFLKGDWEVEGTAFADGQEVMKRKGFDRITYNEDANALIIRHADTKDKSYGVRVIAYDSIDDEFDVAYVNPESPQGIMISNMKVKKLADNKYEMMDSFTERNGKKVKLRHELIQNSNDQLEWIIYEENGPDKWEKTYSMNLKKEQ